MTRLSTALPLFAALLAPLPALSADLDPSDWDAVLEQAQGQTVYWHAWGGSTATNDFITWIGEQVAQQGVTLEHVKLADTADAVTRVLNEKQAGQDDDSAVDLIWINGPNFAAMKEADLLFGPFAEQLPNWEYVDTEGKTVQSDFTVPTEGYESPWAMAQVVFMYDSADMEPQPSAEAILKWAKANPGRFTYPQPPDFLGATFLKQTLIELTDDSDTLSKPVDEADYAAITEPLWEYLDALTPVLWRSGSAYPATGPAQLQLLADNEIDLAISFSPGEASTAIANNQLPAIHPYLRSGKRHAGQRLLCGDPLQFGLQGRGDGRRERPAVARGASPRAGPGDPRLRHRAVDGQALRRRPRHLRRARSRRRHAEPRGTRHRPARAASELDDPHHRGLDPPLRRRSVDPCARWSSA